MALPFFLSPPGRALLDQLAQADLRDSNTLTLLTQLRRDVSPDIAGAALTLARLRQRAVSKFSRADSMFFTSDALEQASSERISTYRAMRFHGAGYTRVADLGCGIGGDTLALAAHSDTEVLGLDLDYPRLQMAHANLAVYDRAAHFIQADLTHPLPLQGVQAAFFDPARRAGDKRIFSVRDYHPPLDIITRWDFAACAVKLSPGVDLDELLPYTEMRAGVEFISVNGDLKEAVLWGGELGFAGRRAARLDDQDAAVLAPLDLAPLSLSEPLAYLYEPDPAVIRAGLLSELGNILGVPLFRLDETIAYLTSESYVISGWARCWPVWDWMPFHLKRLRAALRERGIGRVTVKKRGSPITPEELTRQLRLDGEGESAVVVLTRVAGQHVALICGAVLNS